MRRPGITLAVAALVVVLAAAAAARLRPTAALEVMMARDDPAAQALGTIIADFGSFDDLWILATLPEGADDPAPLRAFGRRLADEIGNDPDLAARVVRVDAGLDDGPERAFVERVLVPAGAYFLDDEGIAALRDRLEPAAMAEQMRRNEDLITAPGPAADAVARAILRDPLRLREILAPRLAAGATGPDPYLARDGRSRLVRVGGVRHATDLDFTRVFLADVRAAADRANVDGLDLGYTGGYAISAASERAIRGDMIRSVFAAVILMQLVFLIAYRRLSTFPVALLPAAIGIVVAFGIYQLSGRMLTPVTAVVGAILAGLGVDYGVHLLSHVHHRAGEPMAGAVRAAVRELRGPLIVAASSSVAGLAAIGFSSIPAVRDFAVLAALGLAGSLAAALVVAPALLVVLERWRPATGPAVRAGAERLVTAAAQHGRLALAAVGAVLVVAVAAAATNPRGAWPMERDLQAMHPRPNPALDLQSTIAERFGHSPSGLAVLVRAAPGDLVAAAHDVAGALAADAVRAEGVRGATGLSTLLPDPRRAAARRAAVEAIDVDRVVADFRSAAEASIFDPAAWDGYVEFLRTLLRPGPAPGIAALREHPDLAMSVLPRAAASGDAAPTETILLVDLDEPLTTVEHRAAAIEAIRRALVPVPGAVLTGLSVIGHDTQGHVAGDLARLLGIAALAVLVLLAAFLRRPVDVLLALLPVAFGVACLLAGLRVLGDGFDMINVISLPLLAGIGVDDGVFVMSICRSARERGESAATLRRRLAASAHAITVTSATSGLAFGSLVFTSTPAIQSLGRMSAVGIAACWAATLFGLVPIVLARARRREAAPC